MAARRRYPDPHEQLLKLAREARERGEPFERFWVEAVRKGQPNVLTSTRNPPARCVLWPSDSTPRIDWQTAIYATREAWRRAYEGERATQHEQALRMLAPVLERIRRLREAEREGFGSHVAVA